MISLDDPESRIQVCGKQVLLDGRHLADAVSPQAAHVIGLALTYAGLEPHRVPPADAADMVEFFA